MPGENDDVPPRSRGAVRPPPSSTPGDAPDAVEVPRMTPPPPSLGALVEHGPRPFEKARSAPASASALASPWLWVALALATAALTAYLTR